MIPAIFSSDMPSAVSVVTPLVMAPSFREIFP